MTPTSDRNYQHMTPKQPIFWCRAVHEGCTVYAMHVQAPSLEAARAKFGENYRAAERFWKSPVTHMPRLGQCEVTVLPRKERCHG